jgi:lysophospholipid acyltransferase (LPLAT)-like uncharacterized protein
MKKGILKKLSLAVIPFCVAWLMRIWFSTCRVKVYNEEQFREAYEAGEVIIASFWHYTIIYTFYFLREYQATVMVSASDDGDYIAALARNFGFGTARGSSNRKGVAALKKLLRIIRKGENCAMVADGSQGPAKVAQAGAVLLASRTGVPLVPMTWAASSCFTIHSWDRTAIPLPFSRIDYYFGEFLHVPAGVKGDEVEKYRSRLEEQLNSLYDRAWKGFDRTDH